MFGIGQFELLAIGGGLAALVLLIFTIAVPFWVLSIRNQSLRQAELLEEMIDRLDVLVDDKGCVSGDMYQMETRNLSS